MKKAIFLDRDGTINYDKHYVHKIEDWEFIPGAVEGLKLLSDEGYLLIIITNQSGISRGYYTVKELDILHNYLIKHLKERDIHITKIYFCPHHPKDDCSCRKPAQGMINQAVKELDIDLGESFCIGDKTCDIKLGKDAGCTTILVKTGKAGSDGEHHVLPDFIAEDLYDAAEKIMRGDFEEVKSEE